MLRMLRILEALEKAAARHPPRSLARATHVADSNPQHWVRCRSMWRIQSATLRIVALRGSRLSRWPVEHSANVADVADSGGPQEGGGETPPRSLARANTVPPPNHS